jgi:tetratricopeptide (TPR) repeat protein
MFFWIIRGHVAEGLRWYRRILGVSSLPQAAESRALLGAAVMSYWQGAHDRARADADRVLTIARRAGDLDMVAQAEHVLGHVEYAVGDMAAARGRFARSIDGFRALEIPWGTGLALSGLAEVALAMGDAAEAERLIDEAHSGLRSAGPWFLSLGLYVRATAALRRGDVDRAIALVARNLTGIRALHDASAFIYTLVPLAAAATLKGDHAWAARILGARDAVINRTGVALVDRPAHDLLDRADREARERLGPHRWADEYAIGRRTSIDALLKDIDAVLLRESARPSAS